MRCKIAQHERGWTLEAALLHDRRLCVPVLSALNDNGVNVRPDQHRGLEMVVDCLLLFRITPTTGDVGGSKMANDDVLAASAHG